VLLDARLEAVAEVVQEATNFAGRNYHELSLVEDDAQTLHIYEGQLKELPHITLEQGKRYTLRFKPFMNNRWVELKLVWVEPAE
jgi:hypothetical protein